MKIAEISPRATYTWTGVSLFDIPFPFYRLDSIAITIGEGGISGKEEELIYAIDYTITGVAASSLDSPIAFIRGSAQLTASGIAKASSMTVLTIHRNTAIEQQYGYTELDSFPAASHENALGRAIVILQEQAERQGRTLVTPITSDELIQYSDLVGIRDAALTATAEAIVAAESAGNKAQQAIDASQEATSTAGVLTEKVDTALGSLEGIQSEIQGMLDNLGSEGVVVLAATQTEMDDGVRTNVYASPSTIRGSLAPITDTTSVTKLETPAGAQAKVVRINAEITSKMSDLSYDVYTTINSVTNNVAAIKVDIANIIAGMQTAGVDPIILTSSGSWTPPSTGVYMINMIGGGGGGGGCYYSNTYAGVGSVTLNGGGGGSGGSNTFFVNFTDKATHTYVIGHGGGQSQSGNVYSGDGGGATYMTVGMTSFGVGGGGGGGTGSFTRGSSGSFNNRRNGGGGGAGGATTYGAGTGYSGGGAGNFGGGGGAGGGHYGPAGGEVVPGELATTVNVVAYNGGNMAFSAGGISGSNGRVGGACVLGQNVFHGLHYGTGSAGNTITVSGITTAYAGHETSGNPGIIFIYFMGGSAGGGTDTALASQVASLVADVTTTKAKVDTLAVNVSTISTKTDRTVADLTTTNSTIAKLSTDLVTLQTKVAQLTGDSSAITELETQIISIKEDIVNLQRYAEDTQGIMIPSIERDVAALVLRVTTLEQKDNGEVINLGTRLTTAESNISDLGHRVTTIESSGGSGAVDLTAVENRLTAVETRVGTVEGATGLLEAKLASTDINVGFLQTDVNAIQSDMPAIKSDISTMQTAVASKVNTSVFNAAQQIMYVYDKKGSDGGTFTAGAWRTRDLNTVGINTITGASLANNQVTLPAGTYFIEGSAPARNVSNHNSRLYNITTAASMATGQNQVAIDWSYTTNSSVVKAHVILTTTSVIELQHQCQVTFETYGFGSWTGFGDSEIYSMLTIRRIS